MVRESRRIIFCAKGVFITVILHRIGTGIEKLVKVKQIHTKSIL